MPEVAGVDNPPRVVWLPDTGGGSARPTRSAWVTSVPGTSKVDGPGPGVSHEHELRPRQGRDRHPPVPRRAPPHSQAHADPAAAGSRAAVAAIPIHLTLAARAWNRSGRTSCADQQLPPYAVGAQGRA